MRGKGKGRRRKAEKRELGERGSEGGKCGREGGGERKRKFGLKFPIGRHKN